MKIHGSPVLFPPVLLDFGNPSCSLLESHRKPVPFADPALRGRTLPELLSGGGAPSVRDATGRDLDAGKWERVTR